MVDLRIGSSPPPPGMRLSCKVMSERMEKSRNFSASARLGETEEMAKDQPALSGATPARLPLSAGGIGTTPQSPPTIDCLGSSAMMPISVHCSTMATLPWRKASRATAKSVSSGVGSLDGQIMGAGGGKGKLGQAEFARLHVLGGAAIDVVVELIADVDGGFTPTSEAIAVGRDHHSECPLTEPPPDSGEIEHAGNVFHMKADMITGGMEYQVRIVIYFEMILFVDSIIDFFQFRALG